MKGRKDQEREVSACFGDCIRVFTFFALRKDYEYGEAPGKNMALKLRECQRTALPCYFIGRF
jgi:hypothetical protein